MLLADLYAPCGASILDTLAKAKLLTIDFEDDEDNSVEVKIPRMGEALAALKFCEENKK